MFITMSIVCHQIKIDEISEDGFKLSSTEIFRLSLKFSGCAMTELTPLAPLTD